MAVPFSNDLRKRIIESYNEGLSVKTIMSNLRVSKTAVYDLLALYKETGEYTARPHNAGRKPSLNQEQLEGIRKLIAENSDIELQAIKDELQLPISLAALCKIINNKLKLVRKKKTLFPIEQKRPDVVEKRQEWEGGQKDLPANSLVFLDESGSNTGMTRIYGRALPGERIYEYVPDVRYETTTILSSVRLDGTTIPVVFPGALNGEIFKTYINQFLVPSLKPGDIVVMDNLSSHKVEGVMEAITAAGASIRYLPPYSPEFNPIELMWSKIKAFLRAEKPRCYDTLFSAIGNAFNSILPSDISGWFIHAGYSL